MPKPDPEQPEPALAPAPAPARAWSQLVPPGLIVVYFDQTIVVVDKPSGLLAVPGKGPAHQDCVPARVLARFPDATGPLVVHRLDMDTSGLMVLGLSPQAQRALSLQFEQRRVAKTYIAVVDGLVEPDTFTIEAALRLDVDRRPIQIVDPVQGKPALTHGKVLARSETTTRVELTPITGRTHQLRVHMASIGHSILGDPLYAHQGAARAPRLLLHAATLLIEHPLLKRPMPFSSPVPF